MLCMVRMKACQRCGGDLSLEFDVYGVYASCIQCGASWSKSNMVLPEPTRQQLAEKKPVTRTIPAKR